VTEVTVGVDSRVAGLVDGPTDDYESWDGEFAEALTGEAVLYGIGCGFPQVNDL